MSLAGLLTVVSEYVADTIPLVRKADGSQQPPPGTVVRYWGDVSIPHYEATDAGFVSVNMEREFRSIRFPVTAAGASGGAHPGVGYIVADVSVRFVRCWAGPTVSVAGAAPQYDTWNDDTGLLAEISDVVARALLRLECDGQNPPNQDFLTLLGGIPCGGFQFVDARPINPKGGRAGIQWRCHVVVRGPGAAPS